MLRKASVTVASGSYHSYCNEHARASMDDVGDEGRTSIGACEDSRHIIVEANSAYGVLVVPNVTLLHTITLILWQSTLVWSSENSVSIQ